MVQVFSPPLSASEGKSEVHERQVKLRSHMDLFIKNLTVSAQNVIIDHFNACVHVCVLCVC